MPPVLLERLQGPERLAAQVLLAACLAHPVLLRLRAPGLVPLPQASGASGEVDVRQERYDPFS